MDDIRKKVLVFEQSNTLAHAYELAFLGSDWELILVEDESLLLQISAEEMPDVIVVEQSRISDETLSQLNEVGFALLCSGCRELQEPFLGLLPRPFSVTELFPVLQSTMEKSLTQANDEEEGGTPIDGEMLVDEGITEETFSPEAFADEDESHEVEIIEDDDDDDDADLLIIGEEEEDADDTTAEIETETESEEDEFDVEMTTDSDDESSEIEFETEDADAGIEIKEDSEIEMEQGEEDTEIEIEEDSSEDESEEIEMEAEDDTEIEIEEDNTDEKDESDQEEIVDDEELMEFGSDDVVSLTNSPADVVQESETNPSTEMSQEEEDSSVVDTPVVAVGKDAVSAIVQDELRTMIKELLWEMAPDLIKQTVEEKITELYQQKNQ